MSGFAESTGRADFPGRDLELVKPPSVASLFAARLTVPRPLVQLTKRQRVRALFDDAVRDHPVTVVVGSAGTGKTVAAADWTDSGFLARAVAWVSIDRGLRQPVRFWAAVVEAVREVVGPEAFSALAVPATVDDDFVASFMGCLRGYELCLVLDDVHELDGSLVWDGLQFLVSQIPDGFHLLLLARHDPPLALHRLRVAGALGEIRGDDLAFTAAEARRLLDDGGVHLPPEHFTRLMGTTEGWAAGLRLAMITLVSADDPVAAAERFGGQLSAVAGYVMEEVLLTLGPGRAEVLRRTAVCDRICRPLAEALAGDAVEAAPALLDVPGWSPFVVQLEDSGWYRYHPLLLQTLRTQLHKEAPELEKELHRRACRWLEGHAEWLPALEHAIASEDWDLVASVALRSACGRMLSAERGDLAVLIDSIAPRVSRDRPELQLVRAVGAFCRDDHAAEKTLLDGVEEGLGRLPEPRRSIARLNLEVLRAAAARRAGDATAMTAAARSAVGLERGLTPEQAPGWTAYRGSAEALQAIGELWRGNPRRSQELMRRALAHGRPADIDAYGAIYFLGHYALAEHALGRVSSARDLALRAIEQARRTGSDVRHEARAAHLALAAAEVQRGHADAANAALAAGEVSAARGNDPFVQTRLKVVAVRRCLLLNDLPAARRQLGEIPPFLVTHPRMALVTRLHAALEVEVELAAGAVDRAVQVLDRYEAATGGAEAPDPAEPDALAVPRARVLTARGAAHDVRRLLAGEVDLEGTLGAEAWLAIGLAEEHQRHEAATTEAVARAIDLAAPEEAMFPFLRPRDRLGHLLRRHVELVGTHTAFVRSVLSARSRAGPPEGRDHPRPETLTDRERSVLAYLPTMSSNEEIAASLGISVNTVKQHLKSINRKLGVGSRRDAFRVARDLGLLPFGNWRSGSRE